MSVVQSIDPRTGSVAEEVATETSPQEVDATCRRAAAAVADLDRLGRSGRARMLRAMADALDDDRTGLVTIADRETALGEQRLTGELTRTCFQLRFFADVIEEGGYLEATIDHQAMTPMGPRPDLRRMLRPLGAIAVFGASNFPFAFSVPGGDTASALAAGCPVVTKAHGAHPATSVRAARALAAGAGAEGAPPSTIGLVFGQSAGGHIVRHPKIQAVGFTGSLKIGRMLHDIAASRTAPIPFYGELGALNALVVTPGAAAERAEEIAQGLASSFTLGVGQFCTKPGLAFLPAGEVGKRFLDALAQQVTGMAPGVLLSSRTADGFAAGVAALRATTGVRAVSAAGESVPTVGYWGRPLLLAAQVDALDGPLLEECFGPVLVTVAYSSAQELFNALDRLSPALTLTVHGSPNDADLEGWLTRYAADRVGRLVWNGFPTGVAVSWAMHHGGPYPATTNALHTSVGASAIRRWLRPISYQDVPDRYLPAELCDAAAAIPRRIDGQLVLPPQSRS